MAKKPQKKPAKAKKKPAVKVKPKPMAKKPLIRKPKLIESPEKMYELFLQYKKKVKANPFIIKDWVGKDAFTVYRQKEKPLTIEGFECYCMDMDIIADLGDYFANKDKRYDEYATICSRIRKEVREDQIAGGMAGIYNPSITQRLNSLVDKVQQVIPEQPLLPDNDGK